MEMEMNTMRHDADAKRWAHQDVLSLREQLVDMTADRDSWEAQAQARVEDCVMFIQQRDELLAALEGLMCLGGWACYDSAGSIESEVPELFEQARKAIARAKTNTEAVK
jgi:hypothetical protein